MVSGWQVRRSEAAWAGRSRADVTTVRKEVNKNGEKEEKIVEKRDRRAGQRRAERHST